MRTNKDDILINALMAKTINTPIFDDIEAELREKATITRLPGEEFRLIPGCSRYYASNYGRLLKLTHSGEKLLLQSKSTNKTGKHYYDATLMLSDGTIIKARSHRIIAKTFLDTTLDLSFKNDKRIVNHINNNPEYNNIENLEILLNNGENIKAAIYKQGKNTGRSIKKCYAYNINTKELREYMSTAQLCYDIWNSDNKGYFNHAMKHKSITKTGWRVSYDRKEAMNGKETI